jgi:hypothetical protein
MVWTLFPASFLTFSCQESLMSPNGFRRLVLAHTSAEPSPPPAEGASVPSPQAPARETSDLWLEASRFWSEAARADTD